MADPATEPVTPLPEDSLVNRRYQPASGESESSALEPISDAQPPEESSSADSEPQDEAQDETAPPPPQQAPPEPSTASNEQDAPQTHEEAGSPTTILDEKNANLPDDNAEEDQVELTVPGFDGQGNPLSEPTSQTPSETLSTSDSSIAPAPAVIPAQAGTHLQSAQNQNLPPQNPAKTKLSLLAPLAKILHLLSFPLTRLSHQSRDYLGLLSIATAIAALGLCLAIFLILSAPRTSPTSGQAAEAHSTTSHSSSSGHAASNHSSSHKSSSHH